jgi:hypothetical protein
MFNLGLKESEERPALTVTTAPCSQHMFSGSAIAEDAHVEVVRKAKLGAKSRLGGQRCAQKQMIGCVYETAKENTIDHGHLTELGRH